MIQRLWKDFRNLTPWTVAILATFVLGFVSVSHHSPESHEMDLINGLVLVGYAVASCIAAALLFGQEYDYGTIGSLLAQPVSRKRIWNEKMLFLLGYLFILFLLVQIGVYQIQRYLGQTRETLFFANRVVTNSTVLILFLAWASGPLFALLLKETHTAFWATLMVVPTLSLILSFYIGLADFSGVKIRHESGERFSGLVFLAGFPVVVWCWFAYLLARRRFLTLELLPTGSGGRGDRWFAGKSLEIGIGEKLGQSLGVSGRLIWKEIQVQSSNLFFVAAIFLIWFGLWISTFIWPAYFGVVATKTIQIWDAYAFVAAVSTMCAIFIFPPLVGAHVVAYERNLGVLDWHLSHPFPRWKQWTIKTVVAVSLVAMGGLLARFFDATMYHRAALFMDHPPHELVPLSIRFWVPIVFLFLAIYTSSLSKQPMRAFLGTWVFYATTLLGLRPFWAWMGWNYYHINDYAARPLWATLIVFLLATMAYTNFRLEGFRLRRFAAQMAIWFAFVFVTVGLDRVFFA